MKLHWSPRSPFVRKVMIVLAETGLTDRVDTVRSAVAMAAEPNPDVLADNPLGKIPALVLDDGMTLFDSRLICEYLAEQAPSAGLIPSDPAAQLRCRRWHAFGDGLTDILLLWRIEMARGDMMSPVISGGFDTKVRASLSRLEGEAPQLCSDAFGLGHVALVCALGQMDFRYPDSNWRAAHPALADWFAGMCQRPSVEATAVVDDRANPMGDFTMPLRFEAA